MPLRTPALFAVLLPLGCARPAPPPSEPAPTTYDLPAPRVWTVRPGVVLALDGAAIEIPRPFTPLEVLSATADSLVVRCGACRLEPTGSVARDEVIHESFAPEVASWGTLAEFALAVSDAAARGDREALRPVLAPGFSFSHVGRQGSEEALAFWAGAGGAALRRVPGLLERGLATRDSALWVAPPEHFERLGYDGPRLGFRRSESGRWEWLFLIQGEMWRPPNDSGR